MEQEINTKGKGLLSILSFDPIKRENQRELIKAINEEDNTFSFRDSKGNLCWKKNDNSKEYSYLDNFGNKISCLINEYNPQNNANYEYRLKWS